MLEGGQVGEKKEGMNIKGGTKIAHPILVRGGQCSKNTLLNGWSPSSLVHINT